MNVKDLVNVGIFTVIYFVLFYICGMTGLVPFMAVFYTPLLALIAGIPCVLFFTKTEKFGMVTIMGVLMGLIIFLMGYGYYGLILGICCGLVADLIMKAGNYKSWKMMVLGYAVFVSGQLVRSFRCLLWAIPMLKCIVLHKAMLMQTHYPHWSRGIWFRLLLWLLLYALLSEHISAKQF